MKILCIEDQKEKYKQIQTVVATMEIDMTWKDNCQYGLMELRENKYDIVLLDMSMPICSEDENETFDSYAGMSVLREIKRKRYNVKVIVITGFSDFEKGYKVITLGELDHEIRDKYSNIYVGYIKYDSTSVEWQEKLKGMIQNIERG